MAKAPWTPIQFDSKLNDTMLVSGEGQYVRTSDHEAMVAEMASELEAKDKELQELREAVKRLRYLHTVGKDQLPDDSEIHYDEADCDSHCWLDDLGFAIDEIERAVEGK